MTARVIEMRISNVPDGEFVQPQTLDDAQALADLAARIMYAVSLRLVPDEQAWEWPIDCSESWWLQTP